MDEQLLYNIIGALSETNVPIVFKGALVMQTILEKNNPTGIERQTRDIDGDWVVGKPLLSDIESTLDKAVKRIDHHLYVKAYRDYNEKRSAGFHVFNEIGDKVTSIDLSIRENPYQMLYTQYGISFFGASIDKVLTDKISVISSPQILRRVKDILDVYTLSYSVNCNYMNILQVVKETGRKVGDFQVFQECKKEIEHAYNTLRGIVNKPDFIEVDQRIQKFLKPFEMGIEKNCVWNNSQGSWVFDERIQNWQERMQSRDLEP